MTAIEEREENERGYRDDTSPIWPVDIPPPLERADGEMDDDQNTMQTLEERIKSRYTPAKLDMDAYTVPPQSAVPAHTDGGKDGRIASSIKPCPSCFGVGKVGAAFLNRVESLSCQCMCALMHALFRHICVCMHCVYPKFKH